MGLGASSYLVGVIPVLVLLLLVVLVIAFTRRSLPDGTSLLTPRRVVETYVYRYAVSTVQDLLLYRYGGPPVKPAWYNRPVPGETFAGLVGYLPVWGVLVERLFRFARLYGKAVQTEAF
jgi:hypothetical protein